MKKKHRLKKNAKNKKISDLHREVSELKMKNRTLDEIFRRQLKDVERKESELREW